MNITTPRRLGQSGMLLIEVLISLVIFSFAILGLVGMQATATKMSYDAEDRTRAALLANEIVATMWTQKTLALPTATVSAWQARLANTTISGLPSAVGTISTADASGVVTVTITWQSPSHASGQYVTKIAMP